MGIRHRLVRLRNDYVIRQVRRAALPAFPPHDPFCRRQIIFSGRVQKVGFRLETAELAARLGLTGFCRNLPDGSVLVQLQGGEARIAFLIHFMESLRRIRISEKTVTDLPPVGEERGFSRL